MQITNILAKCEKFPLCEPVTSNNVNANVTNILTKKTKKVAHITNFFDKQH